MYKLSELESLKSARKLRQAISVIAKGLPDDEKFRLKDQIIRSSRSIAANIAEGHGRYHYQENIQYCRMARGSLFETQEHLICALDEGFIKNEEFNRINEDIFLCLKILNGYIAYLKKSKQNTPKKKT